jgi:hypothetical protein
VFPVEEHWANKVELFSNTSKKIMDRAGSLPIEFFKRLTKDGEPELEALVLVISARMMVVVFSFPIP